MQTEATTVTREKTINTKVIPENKEYIIVAWSNSRTALADIIPRNEPNMAVSNVSNAIPTHIYNATLLQGIPHK